MKCSCLKGGYLERECPRKQRSEQSVEAGPPKGASTQAKLWGYRGHLLSQSRLRLELLADLGIAHPIQFCRHAGCKCERVVEACTKVLERCWDQAVLLDSPHGLSHLSRPCMTVEWNSNCGGDSNRLMMQKMEDNHRESCGHHTEPS